MVRFTLEPLAENDALPGQMPIKYLEIAPSPLPYDEEAVRHDKICSGFGNPEFSEFTDEQLKLLREIDWLRMRKSDVKSHSQLLDDPFSAYEYATADYLRQVILTAKTRHPRNLFLYVKKMVENDN